MFLERMMDKNDGQFIVFDGGEGCGKSTQTQLLKTALESHGRRVLLVRDPGSTRIGEMIRAILLNPDHTEMGMRCEMLLYMAARAQMMAETILPALADGMVVISDRFVSSTLSYQLGGDGLTADEIRTTAQIAINGRWPDLIIILDMPADRSIARVRLNYIAQAKAMPDRYRIINADRPPEQVHADVMRALLV
jgi:dTMP kinase